MKTISVKPGCFIVLDDRILGENLLTCDDWDKADFRYPSQVADAAIACNVKITGRTLRHHNRAMSIRIKMTWIGDGEPNTSSGGWMIPKD